MPQIAQASRAIIKCPVVPEHLQHYWPIGTHISSDSNKLVNNSDLWATSLFQTATGKLQAEMHVDCIQVHVMQHAVFHARNHMKRTGKRTTQKGQFVIAVTPFANSTCTKPKTRCMLGSNSTAYIRRIQYVNTQHCAHSLFVALLPFPQDQLSS